jgi:kojibiose phosphorylase
LASDLGQSDEAYERFMQAAMVDLEDVRGNADDGIHGASAGGIWQTVTLGFGGFKLTKEGPTATPQLPSHWQRLKFKIYWRGTWHEFEVENRWRSPSLGRKSKVESNDSPLSPLSPLSSLSSKGRTLSKEGSTLSSIKGVIFDLDGVLTDTAEYHYRGWQRLADEEGIPFDREANEALRGVSRRESLLRIIGDYPPGSGKADRKYTEEQLQEMMDRKNRYYVDSIEEISPKDLLPGAIALLDELREAGIKIGIGSASKNAKTVIEHLGIADKIDAIADGYSVQKSKPAPDLFLYAAKQLGLEPSQCVVVEDAASGVEAALAAGMLSVGLGPRERVGAAHVVLPSLEGVSWANLQSQLLGTDK